MCIVSNKTAVYMAGFEISADYVSAHWAPYLWNVSAHSKNEGAQTNIFCLGKTFEYFKELN